MNNPAYPFINKLLAILEAGFKLHQLKCSLETNPPDGKNGEFFLGYQIT